MTPYTRPSNGQTVQRSYFVDGFEEGSSDYFVTRDHLGSVREVIASNGQTVEAVYEYTVWGEVTRTSGTGVESDFLYTGHLYHDESDLHLTLYRAYTPELGMWLSRDPIAENGGINLYAYVGNNPINWIDPLGLQKGRRGWRPPNRSKGNSGSSCSSGGSDDGFSFKEFFKSVFTPSNVKDVASQVTDVTDTPRTPSIRTGAIGAGVGVATQLADPAAAQGILEGTRSGFPARQQLMRSLENGEDLDSALEKYENKRQECRDAF